jgi:hypothetical protein
MPRKEFESFTRLDASDVNSFLMDQSVMSFAGTAARGSAIGTATEGMVTYLNDINSLSVNNGTAWTTDRTIQVFGGTAARGSAIGTAIEGMYAHLNDTDTLTYYNGSAWVNRIGAAAGVLQVVSTAKTNVFSMASTTYADITDFSVTITPSSATSKIFVIATGYLGSAVAQVAVRTRLVRGSTAISVGDADGTRVLASTDGLTANNNHMTPMTISFLDSPATTSATTYKVQMQNTGGGNLTYLNRSWADGEASTSRTAASITAMEISA